MGDIKRGAVRNIAWRSSSRGCDREVLVTGQVLKVFIMAP